MLSSDTAWLERPGGRLGEHLFPFKLTQKHLECQGQCKATLSHSGHDSRYSGGVLYQYTSQRCPLDGLWLFKELGDFTSTIKDLPVGQRIYLDGPFGNFSIDLYPDASSFVFVAGGIGIVPIMSMLRTVAERGDDTRPLLLIYAVDTWESATFREELEELTERLNLKVVYVLLSPPENWQGESGYVTEELLARYLPPAREPHTFEVFLCGPQPLMDAVERALVHLGVFIGNFHAERFDLV